MDFLVAILLIIISLAIDVQISAFMITGRLISSFLNMIKAMF